jgi:hypothetical protein
MSKDSETEWSVRAKTHSPAGRILEMEFINILGSVNVFNPRDLNVFPVQCPVITIL